MTIGALELPLIARRAGLRLIHDPSGVSPFLIGRRLGAYKRVVTLHDATPFTHPETHTRFDNFLYRTYVPIVLQNIDAVITISETARSELVRFLHIPSDRVHAIPLAADPAFQPVPLAAAEQTARKYGAEGRFVLYVGALEPRKNLPTLLRAFSLVHQALPTQRLVVVGTRRWKSSGIARLVHKLRLDSVVRFTGYVDDADLPALYSAAQVFCFPSLAEGFGLPLLEAMICGAPVVCSNLSSLPEVAGDAGLLVDPNSAPAIAEALLRVLSDADLAEHLRQRGFTRSAQFSWETTAARTVDVYRALVTN
jgi:glycosyltransferase involved in cell wall biosynthesis